MIKRIGVFVLSVVLFFSSSMAVFACDDEQTNYYVSKVLFGTETTKYNNNKNVEMLESALYLCCEQSDKDGQDKLNFLKKAKVVGLPSVEKINLGNVDLFDCAHNSWGHVCSENKKIQSERKDILRKTVVKVFDFGWFNERFKRNSGQIDSFSALLYYIHILADYLADDPVDTEISVKGCDVPAYSGSAYIQLNGNKPSFTSRQKRIKESFKEYSDLDNLGRCGAGISCIGSDTLEYVTDREMINKIEPTGWIKGNVKYDGIIANELYNRCHLIAHSLGGADTQWNLVTGTRYLNEAMIPYEESVVKYINETGNHVMYRATPVYVGNNLVASGIQVEAYSIEDKGTGIQFNIYFYNVQPGVKIFYENGYNELEDKTLNNSDILPFACVNPNEQFPDLMFEIGKQLELLFRNQKETADYRDMKRELQVIADKARSVGGTKDWKKYLDIKECQYDYLETLSEYVPKMLKKETFFKSVFAK